MAGKADSHNMILDPQSLFTISTRLLTGQCGPVLFHLQEVPKPSQSAAKTLYPLPKPVQAITPWWHVYEFSTIVVDF